MRNISKKKTATVLCLIGLALFSFAALPSTAYAAEAETHKSRILRGKGLAIQRDKDGTAKSPATMTLALEPGAVTRKVITFNIASGEIEVDEVKYVVSEGRGLVAYNNRTMAMRFNATGPDGEAVTVKLVGRYFWMWGRLHAARLLGNLEGEGVKTGLLLRAVVRPGQ